LEAFSSLLRGRIQAGEGDLTSRLESWIRPDQKGWLFNNAEDRFSLSHIFGFDMTKVLDDPVIRTASLLYIFHRLDEGWRLLDDAVFSYFIKDKLKTIRKQNGVVGFGTQSAADIVRSQAANTLIEQTSTNVFFPNSKADDESYKKAFQLSDREIRWIRETVPEARSFLIKHGQDSVIAKLDLGSMPDLIKVLSGRTETVAELHALIERVGDDPKVWLPIFTGRASS
jgi:type IV secretion system protein VirB4